MTLDSAPEMAFALQCLSSARRATRAIASAVATRGHALLGDVAVVRMAGRGVCDAPALSLQLGRRRASMHPGAFRSHVPSRALASSGGGGGTAKELIQTHRVASPRAPASNGRAEAYQRIDPVEHGEFSIASRSLRVQVCVLTATDWYVRHFEQAMRNEWPESTSRVLIRDAE